MKTRIFLYVLCFFLAGLLSLIPEYFSSLFREKYFQKADIISTVAGIEVESTASSLPLSFETRLLFVGDTMLARTIGEDIQKGIDPFQYVRDTFSDYDLVMSNLETAVADEQIGTRQSNKLYTFKAFPEVIKAMKAAGIEMVNLANNHTMDFGSAALEQEMSLLQDSRISFVGAGQSRGKAFDFVIKEINGVKIAFVGFNEIETYYTAAGCNTAGSAYYDEPLLKETIAEAKKSADVVIVLPHWGQEYALFFNQAQSAHGRFLIDSGADLVVGAHPHVRQGQEEYKGKLIYYSLGNFVFDGMPYIENADKGYMLEVIIKDKEIQETKLIPISLTLEGYPRIE